MKRPQQSNAVEEKAPPSSQIMDAMCLNFLEQQRSKTSFNLDKDAFVFHMKTLSNSLGRHLKSTLPSIKIEKLLNNHRLPNLLANEKREDIGNGGRDSSFIASIRSNFANFKADKWNASLFYSQLQVHCSKSIGFEIGTGANSKEAAVFVYIKVPQWFFYKSDVINFRMVQKLNFALVLVTKALEKFKLFHNFQTNLRGFSALYENSSIALLFEQCYVTADYIINGKDNTSVPVLITCVPENEDMFEASRLKLDKNNLRLQFLGNDKVEDSELVPSCLYNQQVLRSITRFSSHQKLLVECEALAQNLKSALVLFTVWSNRFNCESWLNMDSLVECLLMLIKTENLSSNSTLSPFALFYAFSFLLKQLLVDNCNGSNSDQPVQLFSIINQDLNIFAFLSSTQVSALKSDLTCLCSTLNSLSGKQLYSQLFGDRRSDCCFSSFDIIFSLSLNVDTILNNSMTAEDKLKYSCNAKRFIVEKLIPLLSQCLDDRCSHIFPITPDAFVDDNKERDKEDRVFIGVKLTFYQSKAVIKGPLPDNVTGCKQFIQLWGEELCKLRRFKDGTICYAVAWPHLAKNQKLLRKIPEEIIRHVIDRHIGRSSIKEMKILSQNTFDSQMVAWNYQGTGEEELQHVKNISSEFQSFLFDLSKKLPLSIQTVQFLDDHLNRNTSVVTPSILRHQNHNEDDITMTTEDDGCGTVVHSAIKVPKDLKDLLRGNLVRNDCLKLQIILESNDKWPSNCIEAIKRLKVVFYGRMAELIKQYKTFPTMNCLYVLFKRTVFAVSIFHPPEIDMLKKELRSETGAIYWAHCELSKEVELERVVKPKLKVLLEGFEQYFPQFGQISRFVKLWLNSHLLLFQLGDICIELLVAAMLENSSKCGDNVPSSVQSGLFEFWNFVSNFDFVTNFIFLHLEDPASYKNRSTLTLSVSDVDNSTKLKFGFNRSQFPPVTIFTPVNTDNSVFTSNLSPILLSRLTKLCSKAAQLTSKSFHAFLTNPSQVTDDEMALLSPLSSPVFTAAVQDGFDVLIRIKTKPPTVFKQQRKRDWIERDKETASTGYSNMIVPIFGVNLISLLSQRIRDVLGHLLLIFCDVLSPEANLIALKVRKNSALVDSKLKNDWLQSNFASLEEELKLIIGLDLIENFEIKSKLFNF